MSNPHEIKVPRDFFALMSALKGNVANENFRRIADVSDVAQNADFKKFLVDVVMFLDDLRAGVAQGKLFGEISDTIKIKMGEFKSTVRVWGNIQKGQVSDSQYEYARWMENVVGALGNLSFPKDSVELEEELGLIMKESFGDSI